MAYEVRDQVAIKVGDEPQEANAKTRVAARTDGIMEQLKRFKDDVKDVKSGMECGMKIDGYDDIKQGDVLECYKTIAVARTL